MTIRRSISTIALSALATCGLTLALLGPSDVSAVDGLKPVVAAIRTPTLTIGNIHIATRLADESVEVADSKKNDSAGADVITVAVGAIPQLNLVATNNGSITADAKFVATATVSTERDRMSRVLVVSPPQVVEEYVIHLKPGESQTIALNIPGKVESGGSISIALRAGAKEVVTKTLAGGVVQALPQVATPAEQ